MDYEELDIVFVSEGAQYEEIDLEALNEEQGRNVEPDPDCQKSERTGPERR